MFKSVGIELFLCVLVQIFLTINAKPADKIHEENVRNAIFDIQIDGYLSNSATYTYNRYYIL